MVTSYQSVKVFSIKSFPLYGIYTITYLDSTNDKVRGVERNENNHQNQHQVKIQLPMKVSRTGGDGERDKEQVKK